MIYCSDLGVGTGTLIWCWYRYRYRYLNREGIYKGATVPGVGGLSGLCADGLSEYRYRH
jgi:hypothetical protein